MLNKIQTTQFIIYRDGSIAKDYRPKVIKKAIKNAFGFAGYYISSLFKTAITHLINNSILTYKEVKRTIMLDIMDYKYNTDLRAQYMSGKRTQAILSTKRQCGLI